MLIFFHFPFCFSTEIYEDRLPPPLSLQPPNGKEKDKAQQKRLAFLFSVVVVGRLIYDMWENLQGARP